MLESTAPFWDIQGAPVREGHRAIPITKETDVLKKTCAIGGLLFTAAAGALVAGSPASAQVPTWGGGGCCGAHSSFRHFSHHRNRNWNGNENQNFNHIRLHIRNRNNNIAVARNGRDREDGLGLGAFGVDGLGLGG